MFLCAAAGAIAQDGVALTSAERAALERLATARARTELLERFFALPAGPVATVGSWAAESVERDRALRLALRRWPRSGDVRLYSDGVCEADLALEPGDALKLLRDVQAAHPAGTTRPAFEEVERAARGWPALFYTGEALRSEVAGGKAERPLGWDDVTYEGMQLAERAARADAIEALLESAAQLRLTNARELRAFLEASPEVRDAVREALRQAANVAMSLAPDQVAEAEARIAPTELVRILTRVHQEHYAGQAFHAADFREMALLMPQQELRAVGLGVPPSRTIMRAPYQTIELDAPAWASETLVADGRYQAAAGESLSPEQRRSRAELEAIDVLRENVLGLTIQRDVRVSDLLAYRRALKDDVVIFLSGARIVRARVDEASGTTEVRVALPLRRLWGIVQHGMQRVEVGPEEAAGPATRPTSEEKP